jgi:hypothetical protein
MARCQAWAGGETRLAELHQCRYLAKFRGYYRSHGAEGFHLVCGVHVKRYQRWEWLGEGE